MARKHARLLLSIWDQDDFVSLDSVEQTVYFGIISSRDLSWCGVMPLLPKRLARNSRDLTERKVVRAITRLEQDRFVITDESTDELVVRRFIHYDEIMRQPNVAKAAFKALDAVHSHAISDVIYGELGREFQDFPDHKGWPVVRSSFPEAFDRVKANPSGNPLRKAS